jgi:NADH dehydrogenase
MAHVAVTFAFARHQTGRKFLLTTRHRYDMNNVAEILHRDGMVFKPGTAVYEVHSGHVVLSGGSTIGTRRVIWGTGLNAAAVASGAGLPQGRGGRIKVQHDLSVEGFPGVYALGDFANIAGADGNALPLACRRR